jgi:predicted DNA-binding transcriptional regulator AlpA
VTHQAAPPLDLAAELHRLADAIAVEQFDVAEIVGKLEALRFRLWTSATNHEPAVSPVGSSRGLAVAAVVDRTGMSKDWLYREARAGRLPFARRLGRRVVFDETGLVRWLDRRAGRPRP